ncbi:ATP binding protein [Saitoella coloradoensis]
MTRTGLLVMGPAGCGKTTFCAALMTHIKNSGRTAHLVNLDPAAERFEWEPTVDIRDLISLDDVMEEMEYGPNGGLIYCFEFLMNNLDWLDEEIGDFEDDYLIFDMPGQIELYTHVPILPSLINHLKMNLSFNLCATYLLESPFIVDRAKFFAGVMSAMSAMIMLEVPHVNVMSKMDLVKGQVTKRDMKRFLDPDALLLTNDVNEKTNPRFHELNQALVQLIDDFHMVSFLPLESGEEESVARILSYVDDATQWAEGQEPKEPKDAAEDDDVDADADAGPVEF